MFLRLLSILLFTGVGSLGAAQSVYQAALPEQLSEHPEFRRLAEEEGEVWIAIDEALRLIGSENVRFYLELALRDLEQGGESKLGAVLDRLAARGRLQGVAPAALLAWEARLIELYAAMARWREVYRYAGPAGSSYLPDTSRSDLRDELAFYELRADSRLAELGAGDGAFSALLADALPGATLYINEVDTHRLNQMAYQLRYHPAFRAHRQRAFVIRGTATSTGLEEQSLDAVIIRNAIHHFEYLDEMLYAVRQSLADGGRLLLRERFREYCIDGCCPDLLPEWRLRSHLEQAGFYLVDSREVHGPDGAWTLMHWEGRSP